MPRKRLPTLRHVQCPAQLANSHAIAGSLNHGESLGFSWLTIEIAFLAPGWSYAWCETKASAHQQRDAYLSEQIQAVFDDSRHTYGSNRVEVALRQQGVLTSRKRVARLMHQLHLRSVRVKAHRPCLTCSVHNQYVVENVLAQHFSAQYEHEKWVTDTTYIPTLEGWLYLVTVLDIFTRQIVGWLMGLHHDGQLALAALTMALQHHRPPTSVILHSDRGSEFANQIYTEACEGTVIPA